MALVLKKDFIFIQTVINLTYLIFFLISFSCVSSGSLQYLWHGGRTPVGTLLFGNVLPLGKPHCESCFNLGLLIIQYLKRLLLLLLWSHIN